MKKLFCKFCGYELERGVCQCAKFLLYKNSGVKNISKKTCNTCYKNIDEDSIFCPYCGVETLTLCDDNNLKRELQGEFAEDVLSGIKKKSKIHKFINKIKRKINTQVAIIIVVSTVCLILVVNIIFLVKDKKEIENEVSLLNQESIIETTMPIETTQPLIELKDMWIKQDGFFYCFDENGEPVVDDWVIETDENGIEKKYYFDIDGKLVVNSWIDGEYYVGSDGAMYVNRDTPDGARVDATGRVIINTAKPVEILEKETMVYYEETNASETKEATTQKSNIAGEIKGVEKGKTYDLYIKDLEQVRETINRGEDRCNITYYYPIIGGVDAKEVEYVNGLVKDLFLNDFKNTLLRIPEKYSELPRAIVLNTVSHRNVNSNRYLFLIQGRLTPRHGLYEYYKYRVIYDRKSKNIRIEDISGY